MLEATFERAYPLALRAARVRSAAAVATAGLPPDERDDLEQEALVTVWRALPRYDPARASLRTFAERVVANRFASLLRARRRSLMVVAFDNQRLATLDGIPAVEFRTDFQRVADSLPERARRLALHLIEYGPTESGRILGVPRSTVYERIRRIRAAFTEAGFGPQRGRKP